MGIKHAPAPWVLGKKTVFKDHGFKVYGYPIFAEGQAIARVHAGSVGKEAFSFGNQEANARLVAAAPDLLSALVGMFDLHEPEGRFQPSHYKTPLAKARNAIAKAIGVKESEVTETLAARWQSAQP